MASKHIISTIPPLGLGGRDKYYEVLGNIQQHISQYYQNLEEGDMTEELKYSFDRIETQNSEGNWMVDGKVFPFALMED